MKNSTAQLREISLFDSSEEEIKSQKSLLQSKALHHSFNDHTQYGSNNIQNYNTKEEFFQKQSISMNQTKDYEFQLEYNANQYQQKKDQFFSSNNINYIEEIQNYTNKKKSEERNDYNQDKLIEVLKFLKEDYKRLPSSMKHIYVDLLFMVDCTDSMQPYIDFVKSKINCIQQELKKRYPKIIFKYAFVGYRDYNDEKVENFDFNKHPERFEAHLSTINASGGDDIPEDMNSGFQQSLQMNWTSDIKLMFIFADSPPHGKKYHSKLYADSFPNEQGKIEESIKQIAAKEIQINFCQLTPDVEKTYNIIKEEYENVNKVQKVELISETIKDEDKLLDKIISLTATSVYSSLSSSQLKTDKLIKNIVEKKNHDYKHHIKNTEIKNIQFEINQKNVKKDNPILIRKNLLDFEKCTFMNCYIQNNLKQIKWQDLQLKTQQSEYQYHIKVNMESELGRGAERVAHQAVEIIDENKHQYLTVKFNQKICKNPTLEAERMKEQIKSQALSAYLLQEFNKYAIHFLKDPQSILSFVESYIVETQDNKSFFIETKLDGFIKHTNNNGYCLQDDSELGQIIRCFPHFTFQFTEGFLMITDQQGHNNVLTDPAIHTLNSLGYGSTNLGYIGMLNFFRNHQCNFFCKKLGLIDPRKFKDDEEDEKLDFFNNLQFIKDNKDIPLQNQEIEVKKLCYLCQQLKQQKIFIKSSKDLLEFCCTQCTSDSKKVEIKNAEFAHNNLKLIHIGLIGREVNCQKLVKSARKQIERNNIIFYQLEVILINILILINLIILVNSLLLYYNQQEFMRKLIFILYFYINVENIHFNLSFNIFMKGHLNIQSVKVMHIKKYLLLNFDIHNFLLYYLFSIHYFYYENIILISILFQLKFYNRRKQLIIKRLLIQFNFFYSIFFQLQSFDYFFSFSQIICFYLIRKKKILSQKFHYLTQIFEGTNKLVKYYINYHQLILVNVQNLFFDMIDHQIYQQ